MDNTLSVMWYQRGTLHAHIKIEVSNNTHENWNRICKTDSKIKSLRYGK